MSDEDHRVDDLPPGQATFASKEHPAYTANQVRAYAAVKRDERDQMARLARELADEAAGSVEYSDWPELRELVDKVHDMAGKFV